MQRHFSLRRAFEEVFAGADRIPWSRPFIVFALSLAWVTWFVRSHQMAPDFTVLYAAGTPGPVYDVEWLTGLQAGLHGPRPFAYPPTLIPVLRLVHLAPYSIAFPAWCAISATLFVECAARLARRFAWLALAAPLSVFACLSGQTTLMIGAAIVFGATLRSRWHGGALFGLVFAMKPQIMLFLPVALVIAGDWRAVTAMIATATVVCVGSLAIGPHYWPEWLASLSSFNRANEVLGVHMLAAPTPMIPVVVLGALGLIACSRRDDRATWLIIVLGASLLVSPHAASYEAALLIPSTVALALRFSWISIVAVVGFATLQVEPWMLAVYVVVCWALSITAPAYEASSRLGLDERGGEGAPATGR